MRNALQDILSSWQSRIIGLWKNRENLKSKTKPNRKSTNARLRDESQECAICRTAIPTFAHIFPESWGGGYHFWNLLVLCNTCNRGIDMQILNQTTPADVRYDPKTILANAEMNYRKGNYSLGIKFARISSLIFLLSLKLDEFIESLYMASRNLRVILERDELTWNFQLLELTMQIVGNHVDDLHKSMFENETLGLLIHEGNMSGIVAESSRLHHITDVRTEPEYRIWLKNRWKTLWPRAIGHLHSDKHFSELKDLKSNFRALRDWDGFCNICCVLAWLHVENGHYNIAFDQLQEPSSLLT